MNINSWKQLENVNLALVLKSGIQFPRVCPVPMWVSQMIYFLSFSLPLFFKQNIQPLINRDLALH